MTFPDHRLVMCLLDNYTVIAIGVVLLAFFFLTFNIEYVLTLIKIKPC